MQVNIVEAKNRLSHLVKCAQAGDEVIIANRGEPVARLVAAGKGSKDVTGIGTAPHILDWLGGHPLPAYAQRSAEEIDAAIEDERNSWG